jgi:hypothetical protein
MLTKKLIIALLLTFTVAILSFPAASALCFGLVGRTPEDPEWPYTVTCFMGLLASSIALLIGITMHRKSWWSKTMKAISAATSGTWLGIYYGGVIAGIKNHESVTIYTVITILLITIPSFCWSGSLIFISIIVMGIVAVYGLAFMGATATFAFFSTNHFFPGLLWAGFSLTMMATIALLLTLLAKEINSYSAH